MRNIACTYSMEPIKKKRKLLRSCPDKTDNIENAEGFLKVASSSDGETKLEVRVGNPRLSILTDEQSEKLIFPQSFEENALELHNGKTSIFVGFSGDQDPFLLRKIGKPKRNGVSQIAGGIPNRKPDTKYDFKNNKNSGIKAPVLFSICPTEYLDPRPDHYCVDRINETVSPFGKPLLDLYFKKIHSSYPILDKSLLQQADTKISATLLATIYLVSTPFLDGELENDVLNMKNNWYKLYAFITQALPLEKGAPTLQTLQTLLLKLHLRPLIIRNANLPQHWVQSASLVALAQDIGLNLDPSDWDVPLWETKMRRILWWTVYVHDKWESLGLSRPTHIRDEDFHVEDLTEADLELNRSSQSRNEICGGQMFVALVRLSKVLSDMLLKFYSIKSVLQNTLSPEEVIAVGSDFMNKLNAIEKLYFPKSHPDSLITTMVSLKLASTTISLACYRSILYSDQECCFPLAGKDAHVYASSFNSYLSDTPTEYLDDHWWCYSRVNFSIVGACILTFYTAAIGKNDEEVWKEQVDMYRTNLQKISNHSHVTHLALLRFDVLKSNIDFSLSKSSIISESLDLQYKNIFPAESFEISKFNAQSKSWDDNIRLNQFATDNNIFLEWLQGSGFSLNPEWHK